MSTAFFDREQLEVIYFAQIPILTIKICSIQIRNVFFFYFSFSIEFVLVDQNICVPCLCCITKCEQILKFKEGFNKIRQCFVR